MRKMDNRVHIYIFPIPSELNPEREFNDLVSHLPSWRFNKAMSYINCLDRYLCAKSFIMLKDGLKNDFGITGNLQFEYSEYGKPSLKGYPFIYFNISHCNNAVACAISSIPVGIDVECIQFDEDIANNVFNENELRLILSSNDKEQIFTELWTKKESYLKMTGIGLVDDLKDLEYKNVSFQTTVNTQFGYVVTVATQQ